MSSPTFRPTPAAGSGTGDMTKAVYDTDDDGKVDSAKTLDGFDSADFASRTASDLTLYVYEDATGDADGSSKANGFTTLQAAIDAIPDVAQNVTIIVCKGSTNYLGQTTTIQKASVKSLTIRGEFYAYEACDANAVAGKVVDADADFSNFEVGDRVVCTKYSGTVGLSSIEDYFYATITEVGEGYVQTSEETKVPTTGWRYLINQTVFDGNDGWDCVIHNLTPDLLIQTLGLSIINANARAITTRPYVDRCIIYDTYGISANPEQGLIIDSAVFIPNNGIGGVLTYGPGTLIVRRSLFVAISGIAAGAYISELGRLICYYSGFFGLDKALDSRLSTCNIYCSTCYIDSSCTYGAYGYNITLVNCTNNAATPVTNLTSGGSIEEWDGQALPSIDDATGGQVLALKSDKSALEFATVSGGASAYGDLTDIPAAIAAIDGLTPAANKIPYYTAADSGALMDVPERNNLIINGDFSIAQRGTSFTSETWRKNDDDSYLLDRWLLLSDGNDIVDVTQISGAFSRSRYALQAEVETASKRFGFCQIIEANTCIPLRGQKVSISFAAKTVTDKVIGNVRVAVLEWTGTADTVTSDVVADWASNLTWATNWAALNTPANLALTTSEQTFKVEDITIGASCNNLAIFVWVDDTDCAADDILQLGEVQVVRGSVVPGFVSRDDLISCQRRYWSPASGAMSNADLGSTISNGGVALGQLHALNCKFAFISGIHTNGSGGGYPVLFPVSMAITPTVIFFGNSNAAGKWYRQSDTNTTWNTPNATNLSNAGFLISSSVGAASYGIYMCGGFSVEAEL